MAGPAAGLAVLRPLEDAFIDELAQPLGQQVARALHADPIRVDLVTPKPCTYADKIYSDGSVVKMDGGVLRECKDGSWVPYQAPPKS